MEEGELEADSSDNGIPKDSKTEIQIVKTNVSTTVKCFDSTNNKNDTMDNSNIKIFNVRSVGITQPVFGIDIAKKRLKAFGNQKKFNENSKKFSLSLKQKKNIDRTIIKKDKPITPQEKAKLTRDAIEQLKKNEDRGPICLHFDAAMIHHIQPDSSDNLVSNKVVSSLNFPSLEAIKCYEDADEINKGRIKEKQEQKRDLKTKYKHRTYSLSNDKEKNMKKTESESRSNHSKYDKRALSKSYNKEIDRKYKGNEKTYKHNRNNYSNNQNEKNNLENRTFDVKGKDTKYSEKRSRSRHSNNSDERKTSTESVDQYTKFQRRSFVSSSKYNKNEDHKMVNVMYTKTLPKIFFMFNDETIKRNGFKNVEKQQAKSDTTSKLTKDKFKQEQPDDTTIKNEDQYSFTNNMLNIDMQSIQNKLKKTDLSYIVPQKKCVVNIDPNQLSIQNTSNNLDDSKEILKESDNNEINNSIENNSSVSKLNLDKSCKEKNVCNQSPDTDEYMPNWEDEACRSPLIETDCTTKSIKINIDEGSLSPLSRKFLNQNFVNDEGVHTISFLNPSPPKELIDYTVNLSSSNINPDIIMGITEKEILSVEESKNFNKNEYTTENNSKNNTKPLFQMKDVYEQFLQSVKNETGIDLIKSTSHTENNEKNSPNLSMVPILTHEIKEKESSTSLSSSTTSSSSSTPSSSSTSTSSTSLYEYSLRTLLRNKQENLNIPPNIKSQLNDTYLRKIQSLKRHNQLISLLFKQNRKMDEVDMECLLGLKNLIQAEKKLLLHNKSFQILNKDTLVKPPHESIELFTQNDDLPNSKIFDVNREAIKLTLTVSKIKNNSSPTQKTNSDNEDQDFTEKLMKSTVKKLKEETIDSVEDKNHLYRESSKECEKKHNIENESEVNILVTNKKSNSRSPKNISNQCSKSSNSSIYQTSNKRYKSPVKERKRSPSYRRPHSPPSIKRFRKTFKETISCYSPKQSISPRYSKRSKSPRSSIRLSSSRSLRRSPSPRSSRRSPLIRFSKRLPSPRSSRRSPSPRSSRRLSSPRSSRRLPSPRSSRRLPSPRSSRRSRSPRSTRRSPLLKSFRRSSLIRSPKRSISPRYSRHPLSSRSSRRSQTPRLSKHSLSPRPIGRLPSPRSIKTSLSPRSLRCSPLSIHSRQTQNIVRPLSSQSILSNENINSWSTDATNYCTENEFYYYNNLSAEQNNTLQDSGNYPLYESQINYNQDFIVHGSTYINQNHYVQNYEYPVTEDSENTNYSPISVIQTTTLNYYNNNINLNELGQCNIRNNHCNNSNNNKQILQHDSVTGISSTFAVQKGNVLEIVPASIIPKELTETTKLDLPSETTDTVKNDITNIIEEIEKTWEDDVASRHIISTVQRYGNKKPVKGILIKTNTITTIKSNKKVLFSDGVYPGNCESPTSESDGNNIKLHQQLTKTKKFKGENKENEEMFKDHNHDILMPPLPPSGSPAEKLAQPINRRTPTPQENLYFHFDSIVNSMYISQLAEPIPPRLQNDDKYQNKGGLTEKNYFSEIESKTRSQPNKNTSNISTTPVAAIYGFSYNPSSKSSKKKCVKKTNNSFMSTMLAKYAQAQPVIVQTKTSSSNTKSSVTMKNYTSEDSVKRTSNSPIVGNFMCSPYSVPPPPRSQSPINTMLATNKFSTPPPNMIQATNFNRSIPPPPIAGNSSMPFINPATMRLPNFACGPRMPVMPPMYNPNIGAPRFPLNGGNKRPRPPFRPNGSPPCFNINRQTQHMGTFISGNMPPRILPGPIQNPLFRHRLPHFQVRNFPQPGGVHQFLRSEGFRHERSNSPRPQETSPQQGNTIPTVIRKRDEDKE